MKWKLLKLIVMVTRLAFNGLLVLMITTSILVAKEGHAQRLPSIDQIKVTLNTQETSYTEVFQFLEKKTGFYFSFDKSAISTNERLSLSLRNKSLREVLTAIAEQSGLQFTRINNNIVVKATASASAQVVEEPEQLMQMRISGKVISSDDKMSLPGVNVLLKGTTTGTVTDMDGNYSLQVPGEGAVLVFSAVGFVRQEVVVGVANVIDITLVQDVTSLSEVVVIGYGQRERKDLTGSISQINSEDITRQVTMSPEFALQGRMTGVFVSNPGSSPTARPEIRIRGVGTLGFNDPLYVVDGVPLTEGGNNPTGPRMNDQRGPINVFALINPNDIESITVLKDASATAIYGVRAANGVVLIITKRGSEGKARVDINASYGIQNIPRNYNVTNVQEYVQLSREAFTNANFTPAVAVAPLFNENSPEYLGNSPWFSQDWQDAALVRNAAVQDYSISISGGNKMSNFSVGVGYSSQENAQSFSKFDRFSLSVNSDHKLNKWLKVGETYRVVFGRNSEGPSAGALGSLAPPWQPLFDDTDNGLLGFARTNRTIANANRGQGWGPGTQANFKALQALDYNERTLLRNLGAVYAEASPIKGLRFRGTYSFDYFTNSRESFEDMRRGFFQPNQGFLLTGNGNTYGRRGNENINLVGEFLIGYTTKINKHNIDVILNAMDQRVFWNISQAAISANSPLSTWEQRRIEEGWFPADKNNHYERIQSGLMGYMAKGELPFQQQVLCRCHPQARWQLKIWPGLQMGYVPLYRCRMEAQLRTFYGQYPVFV
jgi:TonB-linked SusC/RagA family outer membrane protein